MSNVFKGPLKHNRIAMMMIAKRSELFILTYIYNFKLKNIFYIFFSTSSDESDCRQRKRLRRENSSIKNKNYGNRKGRKAPDYYDKIEKVDDRFVCLLCQKSFSLRKDCGRHIVSIHVRPILFSCEFCGQGFSRKDKIQQHIKRMHSDIPSGYLDDNCNDNSQDNKEKYVDFIHLLYVHIK